MKLLSFLLFISFFVFCSCDKDPVVEPDSPVVAPPMMPLEVGNQWIYHRIGGSYTDTVKMTITRTVIMGGKEYFVLTSSEQDAYNGMEYIHYDAPNYFISTGGAEVLFLKDKLLLGETFPCIDKCGGTGPDPSVDEVNLPLVTPMKTFQNVSQIRCYRVDTRAKTKKTTLRSFQPGIGLVNFHKSESNYRLHTGHSVELQLIGYTINGQTEGFTY